MTTRNRRVGTVAISTVAGDTKYQGLRPGPIVFKVVQEKREMLTDEEKTIINVVRLNRITPRDEIVIKRRLGRIEVTFKWRSKSNFMGRFGGGWNWVLGLQIGGKTLIINILVCSVRIAWTTKTTG